MSGCSSAFAQHGALGDRIGETNALHTLGYAYQQLGHHTEALLHYQGCLDLARELNHLHDQADALRRIGDTHHSAGEPAQAVPHGIAH